MPPPLPWLPPHRATKEHLAPSYPCSSAHLAHSSSRQPKALRWVGSSVHWQQRPEARPLIPAEPMGIHSVPAWQPGTGAGRGGVRGPAAADGKRMASRPDAKQHLPSPERPSPEWLSSCEPAPCCMCMPRGLARAAAGRCVGPRCEAHTWGQRGRWLTGHG